MLLVFLYRTSFAVKKSFAYRFSHDSHLDIDREGLTVYCRSSSGDSVDFGTICTMYQCDCLVIGAS